MPINPFDPYDNDSQRAEDISCANCEHPKAMHDVPSKDLTLACYGGIDRCSCQVFVSKERVWTGI